MHVLLDAKLERRGLYRVVSLIIVAREIAKYKLDLVGVQEVRCM
jgi:hypothetical protein